MSIHYREFLEEYFKVSEVIADSSKTLEEHFAEWIKKNNFPIANAINEEDVNRIIDEEREKCLEHRNLAMSTIFEMDAKEFQTRVLDDTLPDFPRVIEGDKDYVTGIMRDTCHPHILLTDEDFEKNIINYAQAHRNKLRFMKTADFKSICYNL
jgi:hypothetical protein